MGKNQRHKKHVKSEKAKTKLKGSKTKFLPKGLNVTNTAFKIKPIVLVEQLRNRDDGELLSNRKLNVKDLLSRLKHYNENVRFGACEELSQLTKVHAEEIVQAHLSQIIQTVSLLIQDREKRVRKAAVKVISTLLQYSPEDKVKPFFGFLSTNLRCAMTNIDKNVQEDSLLLLDTLLINIPALVAKSSDKILPNFFALISKLRNDSNVERTLTVNLGSKLTSVKWRIQVLRRLYSILDAIMQQKLNSGNKQVNRQGIKIDGNVASHTPLFKNMPADSFSPFNSYSNNNLENSYSVLNMQICTLIPLLFETWIEVVPNKNFNKLPTENTSLNEEASAILSCIMNIMYLLYEYVLIEGDNVNINLESFFLSVEGKKFFEHLLVNFPYSQSARSKQNKETTISKILKLNDDPNCMKENLLICYLFSVLHIKFLRINFKKEVKLISFFINKCLYSITKYMNPDAITCLIKILRNCLNTNTVYWKRSSGEEDLQSILENTIYFYNHGRMSGDLKTELFDVLAEVSNNQYLNDSPNYQDWLKNLPALLTQSEVSEKVVNSLLMLSRKNNVVFQEAFLKMLPLILSNLEHLKISNKNSSDSDLIKKNIINILFFIKSFKEENYKTIRLFIENADDVLRKNYLDLCALRVDLNNDQKCKQLISQQSLLL